MDEKQAKLRKKWCEDSQCFGNEPRCQACVDDDFDKLAHGEKDYWGTEYKAYLASI